MQPKVILILLALTVHSATLRGQDIPPPSQKAQVEQAIQVTIVSAAAHAPGQTSTLKKELNNGLMLELNIQHAEPGKANGRIEVIEPGGGYDFFWENQDKTKLPGFATACTNQLKPGTYTLKIVKLAGAGAQGPKSTVGHKSTYPYAICTDTMELEATTNTGRWRVVSGGGRVAAPDEPQTYISFLSKGKNIVLWEYETQQGMAADTFVINNHAVKASTKDQELLLCENYSLIRATEAVNGAGKWSASAAQVQFDAPNAMQTQANHLPPGSSKLFWVVSNSYCEDTATVHVKNHSIAITALEKNDVNCAGDSDGSIDIDYAPRREGDVVSWDGSGTQALHRSGLSPGRYTVKVDNPLGCADSKTVYINEPGPLSLRTSTFPPEDCKTSSGFLELKASGGIPPYEYRIVNQDMLAVARQRSYTLKAGVYTGVAYDANGCTTAKQVPLYPEPIPTRLRGDVRVFVGDTAKVYITTHPQSIQWDVSGADIAKKEKYMIKIVPERIGSYYVSMVADYGCYKTDTARMTIWAERPEERRNREYNFFTPNGDPYNSKFKLKVLEENQSLKWNNVLHIYNSRGSLIYKEKNYQNDWDLRLNDGTLLLNGYYSFKLIGSNKNSWEGYFIVR